MHRKGRQRRKIIRGATAMLAGGMVMPARLSAAELVRPRDTSHIDALLQVLNEVPRGALIEKFPGLIRAGLTREDALAAMSRFAAENIQPWPDVGFKYHAVMVLQSLNECQRNLGSDQAWLPLFWGADYVLSQSRREASAGGWKMRAPGSVPAAGENPRDALVRALDEWDRESAEIHVEQLLAQRPPGEVLQLLMPYSTRDYRSIGHKVIAAANAHRMTAANYGYGATSLIRSLIIVITNSEGDLNPAENNLAADRAWARTSARTKGLSQIAKLPSSHAPDWGAGEEILAAMRTASDLDAVDLVAGAVRDGVPDRVIWEALIASVGEQMLREGSFVAIHSNTMADALRYIHQATDDKTARLTIMLQAAALIASIRPSSGRAGRPLMLDSYEFSDPGPGLKQVFAEMKDSRLNAVSLALSYLEDGGDPEAFLGSIRHYTLDRVSDSHDFKYAEAVIENYNYMQGPWKNRYLATAILSINGPHSRKNRVVRESRGLL